MPLSEQSIATLLFNAINSNYLMKRRYGHHISDNSYWICHEPSTIKAIFERLRNFSDKSNTVSVIFVFTVLSFFIGECY